MKPDPSIPYGTLMSATIPNLRRLAKSLGIRTSAWEGLPDEQHCLARAIGRWYKQNPQKRRKKPVGGRRERLHRL